MPSSAPFDIHQKTTAVAFMMQEFFFSLYYTVSVFPFFLATSDAVIIEKYPKRRHDDANTKRRNFPRHQEYDFSVFTRDEM